MRGALGLTPGFLVFVSLNVLGFLFLLLIWVAYDFFASGLVVSVDVFRFGLIAFVGVNVCLLVISLSTLYLGMDEEPYLLMGNVVFNLVYFYVDFGTLNVFGLIGYASSVAGEFVDSFLRMTVILLLELAFYGYVISDRQRSGFYVMDLLIKLYSVLVAGAVLWVVVGGIGAGIFALVRWSLEPFDVFLRVLGYLLLGVLVVSAFELIVLAYELASRGDSRLTIFDLNHLSFLLVFLGWFSFCLSCCCFDC